MFKDRERALACLEPLMGRAKSGQPAWQIRNLCHRGDLQDLRNRLGLLVPPSDQFVGTELYRQPYYSPCQRQSGIVHYLRYVNNQRSQDNRPIYVDPYGRDVPDGAIQLYLQQQAEDRRERERQRQSPEPCGPPTRKQMLEAALRLAKDKGRDEMRGEAVVAVDHDDFFHDVTAGAVRENPKVSRHLYQPRAAKPKSEWTKNMELFMANSRKKGIQDVCIRRLEKQGQHGDQVRIIKETLTSNRYKKIMTNIINKNDKLDKVLKAKGKR